MRVVALGEALSDIKPGFASGDNLDVGTFQFRMNNFSRDNSLDLTRRRRVNATARKLETQSVAPGDVLFNSTNSPDLVGKSALIATLDEPAVFSNHVLRLRVRAEHLDPAYLAHFLQNEFRRGTFRGMAKAWVNQATVGRDRLVSLAMPLPPLPDQRRIATILDHADALRVKRRQTLTHLENLMRSLFDDMFGEVKVTKELGAITRFFGGTSLPAGEAFSDQPNGALLMKVSDMNSEGNEDKVGATMLWTSRETPRSATVGAGAVVLPKRGASIATNKKRLTTRVTCLDPNLMGVQPNQNVVTSRYLHEWFKSFDLSTITSGSTVPQLNKPDLSPIVVPVPALTLQETFSIRAERIDTVRAVVQRARANADELFASLQFRAFRGEL